jgi:hypothetical protein
MRRRSGSLQEVVLPSELDRSAEEIAESRTEEQLRKIGEAGVQIAGTHARIGPKITHLGDEPPPDLG